MRNVYLSTRASWRDNALEYLAGGIIALIIALAIWAIIAQAMGIKAGYVYKKEYTPTHWVSGSTNSQGTTTPGYYQPEQYYLYIEVLQDDQRVTNWHTVPDSVFNEARIGAWYDDHCVCIMEAP